MSAVHQENRPTASPIDSTMIVEVANYINRAGQPGEPVLHCHCGICNDATLNISACVSDMVKEELAAEKPVATVEEFYSKYNLEHTVFFRCGHIMGKNCFDSMLKIRGLDFAKTCPFCRTDNGCNACGRLNADALETAWPLEAKKDLKPYEQIQRVTLTAAEIEPVRRFCENCMISQIIRKWAQLDCLFPKCPACYGVARDQIVPPDKYPEDHQVWRDANLEPWLRRQLVDIANLVYPSLVDMRDRALAARTEEHLAPRRARLVQNVLEAPVFQSTMKRVVFRPCRQDRQPVPRITPVQADGLRQLLLGVMAIARIEYNEMRLRWYRGDEQFRLWHEDGEREDGPAEREFVQVTGAKSFAEALSWVNPLTYDGAHP